MDAKNRRQTTRESPSSDALARIRAVVRRIPRGKVSTYGSVAAAAGIPGGARLTVRALKGSIDLPWFRVVGAGGRIALPGDSGFDQRLRLEMEGVRFRGRKVDMKAFEHSWPEGKRTTRRGRPGGTAGR